MAEEVYDERNELYWKPEYAALRNILASQEAELSRVKKAATKKGAEEVATKKDTVKEVTIDGKTYQAIVGSNGRIKYLDGYKLRDIKNKTLYQQFLEAKADDKNPQQGGYSKFLKSKTYPQTQEDGTFSVPLSNTQTYRQILTNSLIKEAWGESKQFLTMPDPNDDSQTKRKVLSVNLKIYNNALKFVTDNILDESGINNTKSESNKNALREFVVQSLNDKNWCNKIKGMFIAKVQELAKVND